MDFKNLFGLHPVFYYYGLEHLAINMNFYIKQGIENEELIYISCAEDLYQYLYQSLTTNNNFGDQIELKSMENLILSHKSEGRKGLKEEITSLTDRALAAGYSGIRWICNPSYVIQITSEDNFLDLEEDLTAALRGSKASLVCTYEFEDYLEEQEYINQRVINESLVNHRYLLNDFSLKENREFVSTEYGNLK